MANRKVDISFVIDDEFCKDYEDIVDVFAEDLEIFCDATNLVIKESDMEVRIR